MLWKRSLPTFSDSRDEGWNALQSRSPQGPDDHTLLDGEAVYQKMRELACEISKTTLNWDIEAEVLLSAYESLSSATSDT